MLLPIVGLATVSTLQVKQQLASAEAAGHAEARVRNAGALDVARAAFEQEVGPAYVATLSREPAARNREVAGLPLVAAQTKQIIDELPVLRATTDAAIAALRAHPWVAAFVPRLTSELSIARREIDSGRPVVVGRSKRDLLVADMTRLENTEIDAATRTGLNPAARAALSDLDLVARAAESAAAELELFSASKFSASGAADERMTWVQGWGAYRAAVHNLLARGAPTLVARWQRVAESASNARFDAFLASDIRAPVALTALQGVGPLLQDGPRDKAYSGVLAVAVTRAVAAARAEHTTATQALAWLALGGLLLLLSSVGITILVRRSVSIPLEVLAEQANRISEGELVTVQVGGPREVRTVARALANTVANLNKVEAQAAALASGDLDSHIVSTPLPGPLGHVMHASLNVVVDAIRERERAQADLAHRAGHDALTELPNRAQALILIESALHRAQRTGSVTALMFIDLDRFKAVNDTFGHASGDQVLQIAARRMRSTVRSGDSPARLGGDEFVVLVENVDNTADVVKLAERLITTLSAEMEIDRRIVNVGASIGIGFCQDAYVDADRLVLEADTAVYKAKQAGRGRVEVFDDNLRSRIRDRAGVESAIASGLTAGEFVLHYQPIVDLHTRDIVALEALIRWNRPGHPMIAPDQFIPVAEESSLINSIGRWVLGEAMHQVARWRKEGFPTLPCVAVNISGRHLASGELFDDVRSALTESGCDPRQLAIELTETVLIDDPGAIDTIQALRKLGIRVAIDDFGTGFTSIGQLPNLPVDCLKIDRRFVVSTDPAQQQLVPLMVAAAHAFHLTVVAEGVEHEFQVDQLRAAGVDRAQGYLFARPMPAAEVLRGERCVLVDVADLAQVVFVDTVQRVVAGGDPPLDRHHLQSGVHRQSNC